MSHTQCEDFLVDVPGGNIYAKKWIPEKHQHAAPIVLLHDSLGSVGQWRDFPERLAVYSSRMIVAYDRLGFGGSSERKALPGKEFIWDEANIYFPYLSKALSLDKYVLFGHSVGGAMSIAIAAQHRNCAAVITESSQAFVESLTIAGIKEAQELFKKPGQFEKLERWHGTKAAWVLQAWTDVWLSCEFASWSLEPCIGGVQCPVLAMHGDQDEYGSKAFPKFISGKVGGDSEMIILKDCGHIPHSEKRQEVLDHTRSFIVKHLID